LLADLQTNEAATVERLNRQANDSKHETSSSDAEFTPGRSAGPTDSAGEVD
jgi:hypothetical protein